MDVMLQRHCAKHIYIVPDGLSELMSDISREVLRCHPKNMYTFIADYLDALIITRENARVAARLVQSITEITTTTCDILKSTGLNREEADRIVRIIQRTFRRHLRECPIVYSPDEPTEIEEANVVSDIINEALVPPEIGEEAARIIQEAFRNYQQRREKEKELLNGMIDWRVAARSAIRLYRKTGVSNEEANRAATLIKAAYKGYYTRRALGKLRQSIDQTKTETAVEAETKSLKSERSVRINYDSVIPHVDFDDVTQEKKTSHSLKKESTTSFVVAEAMNHILDKTIKEVGLKKTEMIVGTLSEEKNAIFNGEQSEKVLKAIEGGEYVVDDEDDDTEYISDDDSPRRYYDNDDDDIDNSKYVV